MSIVRHKIYGKDSRPTIYYITGYGGTLKRYALHLRSLVLSGYRVVAFEYDKSILGSGDPHTLIDALHDIVNTINRDKKGRRVAGVYGVSLGSWLGANVLVLCHIKSGMFNTGAGNMIELFWESPYFERERELLKQNGYGLKDLEKLWRPYEFAHDGRRWQGKHVIIMSSKDDDVLEFDQVRRNIEAWRRSGDDITWIVNRGYRHGPIILRNMFRIRRASRFFRSITVG